MATIQVYQARSAVKEQQKWIFDHGGNLQGYLDNYEGLDGKRIFLADLAALMVLEAEYEAAMKEM